MVCETRRMAYKVRAGLISFGDQLNQTHSAGGGGGGK